MKTYKGLITKLLPNQIFVFGSNTDGIHGAGAAKWALENAGAIYGCAKGPQGKSYAIITKDFSKSVYPSVGFTQIVEQLLELWVHTNRKTYTEFLIAYSGTLPNLNGYTPRQMADMFKIFNWGENVVFEEEFTKLMKL